MTKLSVNINKIALLRNSRGGSQPDLAEFAQMALDAGADGLTVHPRIDERHITRNDAKLISREFKKHTEINFEGDIREDFLDLVFQCKPHQCTLVPVSPGEITSNRGFDFVKWGFLLEPVIQRIKSEGIRVSLFVTPAPGVALEAAALGADRIEIYTEPFAVEASRTAGIGTNTALSAIIQLATEARAAGIGLNAGHDLTLKNLPLLLQNAPSILEVSIGHHLVTESLKSGFVNTVKQFKDICAANKTIPC